VNSTVKSLLFWAVLVVVAVLIYNVSTKLQQTDQQMSFSQFMSLVDQKNVATVTIQGQDIAGTTKDNKQFHTYAPAQYDGLANKLIDSNVQVKAREAAASPWASLLYTWGPMLLFVGFWFFVMRQMQSGGNKALSFGKSKAKLSSSSQKKVTFKDVAGVD
jgi:cell division protease FtsH